MASVVIGSLFRDSSSRGHLDRYIRQVENANWPGPVRVIAMHGDSTDDTLERLMQWQKTSERIKVTILHEDTGTPLWGSIVKPERFAHLAGLANKVMECYGGEDYFMWMESDIIWKTDLMMRFTYLSKPFQAPMVIMAHKLIFYDVWAFRRGTEQINPVPERYGPGCFHWIPPFHPCYNPVTPFQVDSAGTCLWIAKEIMEQKPRFRQEDAIVGLCHDITEKGHELWVNPKTTIWHP